MARQMISDGAKVFRVVVAAKKRIGTNDAYDWRTARETGEQPYLYSESEVVTEFYGPYNQLGTAKGQAAFRTRDGYGNPLPQVVGAHVEKANIVWEAV